MEIIISVIIAAYNAEKTIISTLESIDKQICDGVEVIIVNDGSTDSTFDILKRYEKTYIRLFSIQNNGVSNARNLGLRNARGKYIWFVDADDYIEGGAINHLMNILQFENPDLIMANYSTLRADDKKLINIFSKELSLYSSHEDIGNCCMYLLNNSRLDSAIWKNIYKRKFLCDNNLYFDSKLFMNEDGNWLFEVIIKANSLVSTSYPIYIYNMGSPTSITKKKQTLASYKCSNYVYSRWYDNFAHAFSHEEINIMLRRRMAEGYANSSVSIMSMDETDREQAYKLFIDNIRVLNDACNRYGKLIKLGKITGYRVSLKLANCVYRAMRFLKK